MTTRVTQRMASVAKTSTRCLRGGSSRFGGLNSTVRPRIGTQNNQGFRRLVSNSSQNSGAGASNATLRGVLAGAGLSLAAILISYRSGLISIAGESTTAPQGKHKYGTREDVQKAIAELRAAFPERMVSTDPDALKTYGSSPNSYHPESPHSVVVHATSTEDVVTIVNVARKYRIPVVAYSGATSLEGHFSGVRGFTTNS